MRVLKPVTFMVVFLSVPLLVVAGMAPTASSAGLPGPLGAAAMVGTAIEVPGTAALNAGGNAGVYSVSCASAGNCAAGGFYRDISDNYQVFVASEVNGTWKTAIEVPGTAALNAGGNAAVYSVSCPSAGNCAAGGEYSASTGNYQAFVTSP